MANSYSVILGLVVGLTSAGAYLVGSRALGLSRLGLRAAINRMLEGIGMTMIFLVVNLTAAVLAIVGVRMLTGRFVSLYLMDDVAWIGLSLLQGLTFQWWRALR